jgi:hypothetical protein
VARTSRYVLKKLQCHEAVGETVRTGPVMREHDHHEGLYPYDTEGLLAGPLIEIRIEFFDVDRGWNNTAADRLYDGDQLKRTTRAQRVVVH